MTRRGQSGIILWYVMESILAIIFVTGLFVLINRADIRTSAEQTYAAKDLALAREAIETTTNMYYEFDSPALENLRTEPRGFDYLQGTRAVVGGGIQPALTNDFLAASFIMDVFAYVPLVRFADVFNSGEDVATTYHVRPMQTVPCPATTQTFQKIGLVPADEASLAFTNAIASTSSLFVPELAERKALIGNTPEIAKLQTRVDLLLMVDVTTGNQVLVSGSKDGFAGCAIANVLLANGGQGAFIPSYDSTAAITIQAGADVATAANADKVRSVFS